MKRPIIFLLILFCFSSIFLVGRPQNSAGAQAANSEIKITAKSALLVDYNSDTVIFEKNADERLPIASMTKLATLALVFDAIDRGLVHEDSIVRVSENAASVGGSSAFLDAGSAYKLTDLIKTVVIASANDSSVALAEFICGSEESFVLRMNKFAEKLNLKNTHFSNCTGLPVGNHYSSARDMAKIYKTVCNNLVYKKYSKIWMDDFVHPSGRKTGLVNTNRLVKTFEGIEGGKTGYTDAAKFCLTASAKRGDTRLLAVIIGADSSKTRFNEMSKLLGYGFANYMSKLIAGSKLPVASMSFKKSRQTAEVFLERDCLRFMEKGEDCKYRTEINLNQVSAPLKAGSVVGTMQVYNSEGQKVDEIDLIIKTDIKEESYGEIFSRLIRSW